MADLYKKQLGKLGEEFAVKYIKSKKYKVLETNWSCQFGEIDIIAQKDEMIAFIEVKTRKNMDMGLPQEAVNFYKQEHIKKCAKLYMMKFQELSYRFDIIEIIGSLDKKLKVEEINHIENAFE